MLQKSKGNMYDWVTHQHSHLGGECPHRCYYCYVKSFPFRPKKYQGELRLIEKELDVNYGSGKTIFIENCNDLFANDVPVAFVYRILEHCRKYPDNTYVFQTKNPTRMAVVPPSFWPPNSIFGTTIETDFDMDDFSHAPDPQERAIGLMYLKGRRFVTIEPILNFNIDVMTGLIANIRPEFVNIGADSKKHGLPEPPIEKVYALIENIKAMGIEVREKHNLERLKKG